MLRLCAFPGCEDAFTATRGPGRPAKYCELHRASRFQKTVQRKRRDIINAGKPLCCLESKAAGSGATCPQHRSSARGFMNPVRSKADESAVSDLLATFGHASFLGDSGWYLGGVSSE